LVAQTVAELGYGPSGADLVLQSAWLHDIGYADQLVVTGMHALDGAAHLAEMGAPEAVCSLVAYHTGAEYEAEERGLAYELQRFARPPQDDLDTLILADLVSGPSGERVTVKERLDEILERYAASHPVSRAVTRSRAYLEDCGRRAAHRLGYPM
jgi:HD superfamily phosphodiesterase